ncbi:DUF4367 domain-containing protein [Thalassobacillus devorans]|uniref:DUF4367 domain-containing protein n=1 Tax=Thalassobacillus devorans TaxID=279813 RepID=UPI00048D15E2|nr:DUF4367 domain-containing protein [Thalassobacillus devorans]
MKKIIFIVMVFLLSLVGCSDDTASKELVDYNKEKVINSLNDVSFTPEVPTKLPFEPKEIRVNLEGVGGMENSFIKVSFISENQEEVTFQAAKSQNAFDFTEEHVKIQGDIEGKYGEKEKVKILKWNKDDIYYELFVDSDSTSKEEVLNIADNFNQVN